MAGLLSFLKIQWPWDKPEVLRIQPFGREIMRPAGITLVQFRGDTKSASGNRGSGDSAKN